MSLPPITVVVAVSHEGDAALPRIAVEAALRCILDRPGSRVVALAVGDADADRLLRQCLASGAHSAVRVLPAAGAALHPQARAALIAEAAEREGADLVLCGRRASPDSSGLTGYFVGKALGAPVLADAVDVAWSSDGTRVQVAEWAERGDRSLVASRLPAVVLIREGICRARYLAVARERRYADARIDVTQAVSLHDQPGAAAPSVELVAPRARVKKKPGGASTRAMTAAERRQALRGGAGKTPKPPTREAEPVDAAGKAARILEFLIEKGLVR